MPLGFMDLWDLWDFASMGIYRPKIKSTNISCQINTLIWFKRAYLGGDLASGYQDTSHSWRDVPNTSALVLRLCFRTKIASKGWYSLMSSALSCDSPRLRMPPQNEQNNWHKNKYIHLRNRMVRQEIKPHMYGQLIFDEGTKNTQCGKNSHFNKWYRETDSHVQKNEVRPISFTVHKN